MGLKSLAVDSRVYHEEKKREAHHLQMTRAVPEPG